VIFKELSCELQLFVVEAGLPHAFVDMLPTPTGSSRPDLRAAVRTVEIADDTHRPFALAETHGSP
jgi:hypothetical protein